MRSSTNELVCDDVGINEIVVAAPAGSCEARCCSDQSDCGAFFGPSKTCHKEPLTVMNDLVTVQTPCPEEQCGSTCCREVGERKKEIGDAFSLYAFAFFSRPSL